MSEEWKKLSDEQKRPYEEMSKRAKDQYDIDMVEYKKKNNGG